MIYMLPKVVFNDNLSYTPKLDNYSRFNKIGNSRQTLPYHKMHIHLYL